MCLSILAYFVYNSVILRITMSKQQPHYTKRRLCEMKERNRKENVFRKLAIEEIARQKLVYDKKTGGYVRRRQIN